MAKLASVPAPPPYEQYWKYTPEQQQQYRAYFEQQNAQQQQFAQWQWQQQWQQQQQQRQQPSRWRAAAPWILRVGATILIFCVFFLTCGAVVIIF